MYVLSAMCIASPFCLLDHLSDNDSDFAGGVYAETDCRIIVISSNVVSVQHIFAPLGYTCLGAKPQVERLDTYEYKSLLGRCIAYFIQHLHRCKRQHPNQRYKSCSIHLSKSRYVQSQCDLFTVSNALRFWRLGLLVFGVVYIWRLGSSLMRGLFIFLGCIWGCLYLKGFMLTDHLLNFG